MIFEIASAFASYKDKVWYCIENFDSKGTFFAGGKRNTIKTFQVEDLLLNIKSFKKPNLINRIAYRYFRKSKARRSFEYASKLLEMGIGTPKPIAFAENKDWSGFKDSYYVSEQLECQLTYRELVEIPDYPDRDNILRQFTAFSFELHELGIEFKDHSPGNTLIKQVNPGEYEFYLVDLNRMEFHGKMPFELRMKNLSRLTPHKEMVEAMSQEYAKLSGYNFDTVFSTLWKLTSDFQYRFHRKRRLKKKFLFRS